MKDNKEAEKKWRKIAGLVVRYAVIAIVLFGVSWMSFTYFRIKKDGDLVLREAKNARLALVAVGLEYHGSGKSVYTSTKTSGMTNDVRARVQELSGADGILRLVRYDYDSNEVKQLQYRQGQYLVNFELNDDGSEVWTVEYIVPLDIS